MGESHVTGLAGTRLGTSLVNKQVDASVAGSLGQPCSALSEYWQRTQQCHIGGIHCGIHYLPKPKLFLENLIKFTKQKLGFLLTLLETERISVLQRLFFALICHQRQELMCICHIFQGKVYNLASKWKPTALMWLTADILSLYCVVSTYYLWHAMCIAKSVRSAVLTLGCAVYEWLRPDEMMESNMKLDWMYTESGSQSAYTAHVFAGPLSPGVVL